jgi:hypothetical protein
MNTILLFDLSSFISLLNFHDQENAELWILLHSVNYLNFISQHPNTPLV